MNMESVRKSGRFTRGLLVAAANALISGALLGKKAKVNGLSFPDATRKHYNVMGVCRHLRRKYDVGGFGRCSNRRDGIGGGTPESNQRVYDVEPQYLQSARRHSLEQLRHEVESSCKGVFRGK